MLVKLQSRRSCCAFCAPARICVSLCCSQFLLALVTCTDDPHRYKRAIKSQVRSQLISLSIHAVCIVEQIVDAPMPQNSETDYRWIASQINCAWKRSRDSMTTNMAEALKLAARREDLAGVPFQAHELPQLCEREVRGASAIRSLRDPPCSSER